MRLYDSPHIYVLSSTFFYIKLNDPSFLNYHEEEFDLLISHFSSAKWKCLLLFSLHVTKSSVT